jgi:ADP-heptose:LPS heptosyltransferase
MRWPNPLQPPFAQQEINLCRPGELGDVVMSLAVVGAIRKHNPTARINFATSHHEFLAGHPLIDRVISMETAAEERLPNLIQLRYEVFVPLRLHAIDYLAGCVGLRNIAHEIPLPNFTGEIRQPSKIVPYPRPWIAVVRNAGPFTPNKDWPAENWNTLIPRLARHATVIELGTGLPAVSLAPRHVDLRGQTSTRQFCGWISFADLVITPVTSTVHIAAAYNVPTLSILGGYELPANTAYHRHSTLHRSPPCSPCWRRAPCPINRQCLRDITVSEVEEKARQLLREMPGAPADHETRP